MTIFDEATAVRRRADGWYDAEPDARFAIVAPGGTAPPAVNGGALLATVIRAVLAESPHPHPVATSAHYLRVPRLAPARIRVTWLKQGGTAATARAALEQDDKIILDTTVTTGTVPGSRTAAIVARAASQAGSGELNWTGPPPGFPDIADCVDLGQWPGTLASDGTAGYAAHVQMLMDPATAGWRRGDPSGLPVMRGYFRLREDRDPDAYLLAMAVDGLPPVVFGLGVTGWSPTVELTWHMRAVPSRGPLAVQTSSRHVSGGWFDEEAEVWDAAGRLVAQSRQLARVGRGPLRQLANDTRLADGAQLANGTGQAQGTVQANGAGQATVSQPER
jgi:acyl-Coa thioesterase superfamily protein/acyl-CoA thioesterase superfamily protein